MNEIFILKMDLIELKSNIISYKHIENINYLLMKVNDNQ
jgi:hypothetical protein